MIELIVTAFVLFWVGVAIVFVIGLILELLY